jgi:hypothetical protein
MEIDLKETLNGIVVVKGTIIFTIKIKNEGVIVRVIKKMNEFVGARQLE